MTVTAGPAATAGYALTADAPASPDRAGALTTGAAGTTGTAGKTAALPAPSAGTAEPGDARTAEARVAGARRLGAGTPPAGTTDALAADTRSPGARTPGDRAPGAGSAASLSARSAAATSATGADGTAGVTVVKVGRFGPDGPTGPAGPPGLGRPSGAARAVRTGRTTAAGGAPGGARDGAAQTGARAAAGWGPAAGRVVRRTGFVLAADGSYGACLAQAEPADGDPAGGRWFAERWTLDGPEPYAVSLAGARPEDVGSARVLPLPDGRVLVMRRADDRYDLVLAYPTGPRTGEVPVGSLAGTEVRLLPPSPSAGRVFALVPGAGRTTEIWQVHGDGAGPARVMTVAGRCTGGVWLDRGGRLLALDRELDGRTKTAAVDLHTGEVSALLQITEDSDDRLLLAEPDSGLLVLRSDAPGRTRLGWGVLGSRRPVRFPDSLHFDGALLTPVAAQPGQILSPGSCAVALRAQVPGGAESLVLWRPGEGGPRFRPAPAGWLGPTALWLPGRPLRLPYAVPDWPCGLAPYDVPPAGTGAVRPAPAPRPPGVRGRVPRPPAVLPLQQAPLASAAAG